MASKPTIRPIQASDEQTWRTHWHAYNTFYDRVASITETITSTTFIRFLDPTNPITCAVAVNPTDDKPIGFANFYRHPSTSAVEGSIYLHDLFVAPESRNQGVGRALIEYVYARADEWGVEEVYWCTQFDNHRAQLLYTKVGRRTDFVRYDRA